MKSKLFKSRRILLGNCIFGIMYAAAFALINFEYLNFKTAMVISIIFATGILEPVCWMLKIDNVIRRYVGHKKKHVFISDDKECVKQMSDEELSINLNLAKIVIRTNKRQVKIIKTEINKRTNCQLSNERNK